jgi:hypothetical protein
MNKKEELGKINRKTYRKPKLEQVQLVSEEAVLEACKVRTSIAGTPPCKNNAIGCDRVRAKS